MRALHMCARRSHFGPFSCNRFWLMQSKELGTRILARYGGSGGGPSSSSHHLTLWGDADFILALASPRCWMAMWPTSTRSRPRQVLPPTPPLQPPHNPHNPLPRQRLRPRSPPRSRTPPPASARLTRPFLVAGACSSLRWLATAPHAAHGLLVVYVCGLVSFF